MEQTFGSGKAKFPDPQIADAADDLPAGPSRSNHTHTDPPHSFTGKLHGSPLPPTPGDLPFAAGEQCDIVGPFRQIGGGTLYERPS